MIIFEKNGNNIFFGIVMIFSVPLMIVPNNASAPANMTALGVTATQYVISGTRDSQACDYVHIWVGIAWDRIYGSLWGKFYDDSQYQNNQGWFYNDIQSVTANTYLGTHSLTSSYNSGTTYANGGSQTYHGTMTIALWLSWKMKDNNGNCVYSYDQITMVPKQHVYTTTSITSGTQISLTSNTGPGITISMTFTGYFG